MTQILTLQTLEAMLSDLPTSDAEQCATYALDLMDAYLDEQDKAHRKELQNGNYHRSDAHKEMIQYLNKAKIPEQVKQIVASVR